MDRITTNQPELSQECLTALSQRCAEAQSEADLARAAASILGPACDMTTAVIVSAAPYGQIHAHGASGVVAGGGDESDEDNLIVARDAPPKEPPASLSFTIKARSTERRHTPDRGRERENERVPRDDASRRRRAARRER